MYDKALIESHFEIAHPYYLLTIKHDEMANSAKPGQFVLIDPFPVSQKRSTEFSLKRPISIFDVDRVRGTILLYYQVSGHGTDYMTQLKVGEYVELIAPLGKGFRTNIENEKILLIGAGVGIAPLKYLFDEIKDKNDVYCLFAGRDESALKYTDYFNTKKHIFFTCDDGSRGCSVNAVELSESLLREHIEQEEPFSFIYSCGPPIVLKKIGILAEKLGISGQLSLENHMGCGVRACQACTIKTKMGSQKICGFGPVFDIKNLIMEEL